MKKQKKVKPLRTPAQQRAYAEMLGYLAERKHRLSPKRVKLLRARREITRRQAKELLA